MVRVWSLASSSAAAGPSTGAEGLASNEGPDSCDTGEVEPRASHSDGAPSPAGVGLHSDEPDAAAGAAPFTAGVAAPSEGVRWGEKSRPGAPEADGQRGELSLICALLAVRLRLAGVAAIYRTL